MCVNDTKSTKGFDKAVELLKDFLHRKFPNKSFFENEHFIKYQPNSNIIRKNPNDYLF